MIQTEKDTDLFSKEIFKDGFKDGVPIGLGYLAVSFSLGIVAANAGLSAVQGAIASLLNNASAGEYAGFACIAANADYLEIIFITLVTNMRYLLMSCALSSRCGEDLSIGHRLLLGFYITDELFGITIARPGKVNPYYTYGAIIPATTGWAAGTALGIIAGNVLPGSVVNALSVALYGMFLSIIFTPAKKDRTILVIVLCSFAASFAFDVLPLISRISSGMRIIILTVAIAAIAAVIKPVEEVPDAA